MDTTQQRLKRLLWGLFLTGLSSGVFAQQPLYDAYGFNPLALNPAFAGAKGYFNLNAVLFNQLNGTIRPNQIGQVLSAEGTLANGRTGWGFQGFNTNLANFPSSGLTLGAAHSWNLANGWQVRAGVQGVGRFRTFFNSGFDNRRVVDPSFGLGGMLVRDHFMIGLSKPSIGRRQPLFDPRIHPTILQIGYLLKSGDSNAWYVGGTYWRGEKGSISPQAVHVDTKFWIGNRLGLGGSVRYEQNEALAQPWKMVGWGEFRVSEGIRLGVAYDPRPQSVYPQNFQTPNTPGQFQIFFRYEGAKAGNQTTIFDFM
ncbi:MAG: type IX secretion system membrane protein PorP/SprF [Spirosomataceae bacterium]